MSARLDLWIVGAAVLLAALWLLRRWRRALRWLRAAQDGACGGCDGCGGCGGCGPEHGPAQSPTCPHRHAAPPPRRRA
ncbi:MAG: hypothetical protein AB7D57_09770 [Desulfovibrionaceae bacterium]